MPLASTANSVRDLGGFNSDRKGSPSQYGSQAVCSFRARAPVFALPPRLSVSWTLTGEGGSEACGPPGERGVTAVPPALGGSAPPPALLCTESEMRGHRHVPGCWAAHARTAVRGPGDVGGGLTSLVVPGVELLYPQLAQGLGELQLLAGHVVPEEHHVLRADVALGADERQEVLQGHLGAHAHHRLLRAQVVDDQAHGLLQNTAGTTP